LIAWAVFAVKEADDRFAPVSRVSDNGNDAGWSWGCAAAVDCPGLTIFVADVHRNDGKRFVVRADESLMAFVEVESNNSCGQHIARKLRESP
jgi:hypothetical protein